MPRGMESPGFSRGEEVNPYSFPLVLTDLDGYGTSSP